MIKLKKVFYSLAIFLSIFIINLNVVKAEKYVCVYTYTENGKNLTYYVDMDDESTKSPKVKVFSTISKENSLDGEKHTKNGTKWSIQNWENADGVVSPSISFKDSNGTCPSYLVYRPNADGNKDYLYFSTSIVSVNGYYTFKPISNIPDCTYVGQTNDDHSSILPGAVLNVWYNNGSLIYNLTATDKFYNYDQNYDINTGSFKENSELKQYIIKTFSNKKKNGDYTLESNGGINVNFSNRNSFITEYKQSYLETNKENGNCPTMPFTFSDYTYSFTVDAGDSSSPNPHFEFEKMDFENNITKEDILTCGPYRKTILGEKTNLDNVIIDFYFKKNKLTNSYSYSYYIENLNGKEYRDEQTLNDPYSSSYTNLILYYASSYYHFGISAESYGKYISALDNGSCPNQNDVNLDYSDPRAMYLTLKKSDKTDTYDTTFREYLGGLKNPLSIYAPKALDYTLTVGGLPTILSSIDANDKFCTSTECASNAGQYTIIAIEKIKRYCSSVYRYESNNTVKKAECTSFTNFLNNLVNDGVLSLDDISTGCGFVTGGLSKEINKIFNIIKVAGPLLAVLLGMIDFTKAVASGDADKEMKDASKRFIRRLIAAALLFIVPTLLAFLINIFIGDKLEEDVYCDLFDNTISNGRPTGGNINHGTSTGGASGGTSSGSSGGISSPNIDRLD